MKKILITLAIIGTVIGTASYVHAQVTFPFGSIKIHKTNGNWITYQATTSSDVGRGTALITALAATVSGDSVYLASTTYDVSNASLDLSKSGTGGVSIHGEGKYATIIKGGSPSNALLVIGINSEITDLGLVLSSSISQPPIGAYAGSYNIGSSTVRNVITRALANGINVAQEGNLIVDNSTILSNANAVVWNPVATSSTLTIYDSEIFSINSGFSDELFGVSSAGGTVNIYNTKVVASGSIGSNYAIYSQDQMGSLGSTLNVYSGLVSSSGTDAKDLFSDNSLGSLNVTANVIYDPTKTSGTIGKLDNAQIRYSLGSNGASSTILVNQNGVANWQATSSLGLQPSLPTNQGWLGILNSGAVVSSTSPTVNYITATSTTIASTFPYASTTALTSSGSAYFATVGGSVGIATTTPNAMLTISNRVGVSNLSIGSTTGRLLHVNPIGQTQISPFQVGSNLLGNTTAGNSLTIISPNNATYSRSQLVLGQGATDGADQFGIGRDSADGFLYFSGAQTGASGYDFLDASTGVIKTGVSLLRINAQTKNVTIGQGNLGIGTSTPYAKLSVVGEAVAINFTATSSTATSTFAGSVKANDFYSGDGSQGFTGTCTILGLTSITVKDGLIVSCQ